MKFFKVRSSGGAGALASLWPAQCPEMTPIRLAPVLHVPLAARSPADPVSPKPPGTRVPRGGALADVTEGLAPAALAPVAGRIIGVSHATLLNGQVVPTVEFEPDAPAEGSVAFPDAPDSTGEFKLPRPLGRDQLPAWIERLRSGGVWADRPDAPDLLGQLHHIVRHHADTLICSLLDDEPTMCINSILVANARRELLAGLEFLGGLMEAKQVILVVEDRVPGKWWGTFRKLARNAGFLVVSMVNDYPQSDPTLLIYSLLKRRLKPGLLPVDQRVVMIDGPAAVAVGQCAAGGAPMLRVQLAIRDHLEQRSHFVEAPVGTPLVHVLREVGATIGDVTFLRGDLLHDHRVPPDAVIAGGELTIHIVPRVEPQLPGPCVRCSWCVESCPMRIQPAGILEASQRNDIELADYYGLDACIECGVCAYVCPSHLPLLDGIRKLRERVKG